MRPSLVSLVVLAAVACGGGTPAGGPPVVGFQPSLKVIGNDTLLLFRWYPAIGAGPRLTALDYIAQAACTPTLDREEALTRYAETLGEASTDTTSRVRLLERLDTPQEAIAGLPPGPAAADLVIILSGLNASPWYHAPIAERLVRDGHEVVAWQYCRKRGDFSLSTAETMARAVKDLHPGFPRERVSLLTWSFGGVVGALLAGTDPGYRALVSLDAGLGYDYGEAILREARLEQTPLRLPWLQVWAGVPNPVPRSRWVLDSAVAVPGSEVTAPGLAHRDFAAPFGAWRPGGVDPATATSLDRVLTLLTGFLGAPGAVRGSQVPAGLVEGAPGPARRQ